MEPDPLCLAAGPLISWVVSALKRLPWIARYPKLVALLISIGLAVIRTVTLPEGAAANIGRLVVCVLTTWGGSIATYEVVTKPARAAFLRPGGVE